MREGERDRARRGDGEMWEEKKKKKEEAVVNEPRREGATKGSCADGKVRRRRGGTLQRRTCASRAKGPRDSSESVYDTG